MSPPAMQGLCQFDLGLFVSEAEKPYVNSERDHMSVFSDEDPVPAEEGKEAGPRDDNLAAAFARDFVDDHSCNGTGARYEQWAAFHGYEGRRRQISSVNGFDRRSKG